MGAGSAKGIQDARGNNGDADVDRFSVASQDSPERTSKLHIPISEPPKEKLLPQISKPMRPSILTTTDVGADDEDADDGLPYTKEPPSPPYRPPPPAPPPPPPPPPTEHDKKEEKKKSLFGFGKRKEESEEKTNAFIHEEEKPKKESTTSKGGFRLFNWKKESKVSVEKDEHLDREISELQRTFDSLGIVGKSLWDDERKKDSRQNKSQSADDIRNLEPMRNKMNARSKAARSNGIRKGTEVVTTDSGGSRRTFKYSWETEGSTQTAVKEDDHWSYKAIVIDGFDLEKYKKANYEDTLIGSRIPNAIDDDSPTISPSHRPKSPLTYDPMEQKLLATIEREFAV